MTFENSKIFTAHVPFFLYIFECARGAGSFAFRFLRVSIILKNRILKMEINTTLPTFSDDEETNSVVNSVISDITVTELPGVVANCTTSLPVCQSTPAAQSTKSATEKAPRQMRNFTKDGKINVKDKRKGRDCSDAYYYRKNQLKQAAPPDYGSSSKNYGQAIDGQAESKYVL